MTSVKSNAFTLPYTFFREPATKVISDLKSNGLTGINLALNYHASRDFLLRQGPQLEYLSDGFHYYKVDKSNYEADAITPSDFDCVLTIIISFSISMTVPIKIAPGRISVLAKLSSNNAAKLSLIVFFPKLVRIQTSL